MISSVSRKTKRTPRQPKSAASPRNPRRNRPVRGYEIRVSGHLEDATLDGYAEVSVANQADGDALLSGPIPDQSALLAVLLRLHDLGMTILGVRAIKRREPPVLAGGPGRVESREP
jgi:hypothetical protein